MSKGVNKCILVGHLGHGPKTAATKAGDMVCNLDLATGERYKNRSGEWQEITEWHRVVFFGKAAETISQYAQKGDRLYVEGSIRTRAYTGKDGTEKRVTEIMGREFLLLGGNKPAEQKADPATDFNTGEFYDDDLEF